MDIFAKKNLLNGQLFDTSGRNVTRPDVSKKSTKKAMHQHAAAGMDAGLDGDGGGL